MAEKRHGVVPLPQIHNAIPLTWDDIERLRTLAKAKPPPAEEAPDGQEAVGETWLQEFPELPGNGELETDE